MEAVVGDGGVGREGVELCGHGPDRDGLVLSGLISVLLAGVTK